MPETLRITPVGVGGKPAGSRKWIMTGELADGVIVSNIEFCEGEKRFGDPIISEPVLRVLREFLPIRGWQSPMIFIPETQGKICAFIFKLCRWRRAGSGT